MMMSMNNSFSLLELEGKKFFIRINNVSDDLKKIFNSLRLKEINTGVFLKMDNKLSQTLKTIDPYVTYGYNLFYKNCE